MNRNIRDYVKCHYRRTNYFFTQLLTGHRPFSTHMIRIGKTNNVLYNYCAEQVDSEHPEHTILLLSQIHRKPEHSCPKPERACYSNRRCNRNHVLSSQTNYQRIQSMILDTMKCKENEKQLQQERKVRSHKATACLLDDTLFPSLSK